MLSWHDLSLFMMAALAINLTPGPSILYIASVVASNGIKAGIISALGLASGIFCHVVAAACGVTALVIASHLAFSMLRYVGAAYLIFLGLKILTNAGRRSVTNQTNTVPKDPKKIFVQGVLVDLVNPKIGLFFLAFLPQFVNPESDHVFALSLLLGTLFVVTGTLVNTAVVLVADRAIGMMRGKTRTWIGKWIPGTVLIGLGARLAFTEK